ncbi:Hypothetical protein CINCED_3A004827 [Cinara cedri]|uniref:Uncharacterized protein n=1 Tax=Cinara cedri TaxID=506608 RepID=A0A5E4NIR8_9HEMI|nr:Hypothetical protein CINCED_3A004827 [Cinara cedri]
MAIVLSARSKVLTGGAVGVACLLSGLMFCNLFGWNNDDGGGGDLSSAGGVANRASADDAYKKNNWYPTSLYLYQKVRCTLYTYAQHEIMCDVTIKHNNPLAVNVE